MTSRDQEGRGPESSSRSSDSSNTGPTSQPHSLAVSDLVYTLDRTPRPDGSRVVVTVRHVATECPPLRDRVDLYAFKARKRFAQAVAAAFGRQAGDILGALAALLDGIEREQNERRAPCGVVLTPERERAANELLQAPDLLDRAAAAMDSIGYVGEPINKRLAYLVATSRLLPRPLSALLLAPSSTGKSELLEVVARLMPQESVHLFSRVTRNALYYQHEDALRHALVVVDEQDGASDADHALRLLQSAGFLRLALPMSGQAAERIVHGPIALMAGTTSHALDPQNVSRCLELCLDDSPEQTARVLEAQRLAWAGERVEAVSLQTWQDAQRRLEPLEVLVPFAPRLRFPTVGATKARRDQQRYLALIAAHALLAQRQRTRDGSGRLVATVSDYRAVFPLLRHLLEHVMDGLTPRAARLYRALVTREGKEPVTREQAARLAGTSYATALRALEELVRRELVSEVRTTPRHYRLVPGAGPLAPEPLMHPDELDDPCQGFSGAFIAAESP